MFRFAFIGCGKIALKHANLLANGNISDGKLQCVCDLDLEKARKFGEKYNVSYFDNYHDMLLKEKIDVIVILTESGTHPNILFDTAKYKKHFVVEKPIALSIVDAEKMQKLCSDLNLKLFVIKQNRFNLPVQKMREAYENGRFGKLILGTVRVRWSRDENYYNQADWRGTWKLDGGVLANQAIHNIDLLQWMMGKPISVFGYSSNAIANIETEDTAVAIVRFENGSLGAIEATTATKPHDLEGSFSLLGEGGSVVIEGFAANKMKTWEFVDKRKEDSEVFEKYANNPLNVFAFGHKLYYENIVLNLKGKKSKIVDGCEGINSLKLVAAIYESIETKKEVFLDNLKGHSKLGF